MGAFTGRTLIAFYLDNAGMRSMDAARMQIHIWAVEAVTWAIVLYAAFSLLLAVWVFRDARKRDFLPLFELILIGLVGTLLSLAGLKRLDWPMIVVGGVSLGLLLLSFLLFRKPLWLEIRKKFHT